LFYDAATCFDSLACHYQVESEMEDGGLPPQAPAAKAGLSAIAPMLAAAGKSTILSEWDSASILRSAGVPMVESRQVDSIAAALEGAKAAGYPVVLKALAPGVAHKNKMGFVMAGIADEAALKVAYAKLEAAVAAQGFQRALVPFILQPMKPSKVELIAGVSSEQGLGKFLVLGLGGIYTEALNESRLLPIPVSAAAMKKRVLDTRIGHVLAAIDEDRPAGAPSALDGVLQSLLALQALILEHGDRIESVDVNPLLVGDAGCVAVDALVVLKGAA
jgi:acyl-CoA synthetase (NDP forming)